MIDYVLLAKAAMLHDIGKLCYRAGMTDDSEAYAQFGAQWLARLLPQDDERAQQLLRCVSYHRRRDLKTAGLAPDDWAYIIYLADAIAFGAEKAERTADAEFDAGLCLESVFRAVPGIGVQLFFGQGNAQALFFAEGNEHCQRNQLRRS